MGVPQSRSEEVVRGMCDAPPTNSSLAGNIFLKPHAPISKGTFMTSRARSRNPDRRRRGNTCRPSAQNEGLPAGTAVMMALLQTPPSRRLKRIVPVFRLAVSEPRFKSEGFAIGIVLNSSYCSFYVTAEPKQAEYASLRLGRGTRLSGLRRPHSADRWLPEWL